MPEPSELKREARGILRGAAVSPYLFTLLLLAITFVMYCAREYVALPTTVARLEAVDPQLAAALPDFIRNASFPRLPGMFIQILTLLVGITLNAGEALYHLGVRRREEMPYSTLFDGFGLAGRVVTLGLLRTVIIYFLLMFFIVPGVIMAYRYRFAMYNLMEDPSLTAVEALRMSAAASSWICLCWI